MKPVEVEVIHRLGRQAGQVAQRREELDAAGEERRAAAAEVIRQVLRAIEPAMPALASKVAANFPDFQGVRLAVAPGSIEGVKEQLLFACTGRAGENGVRLVEALAVDPYNAEAMRGRSSSIISMAEITPEDAAKRYSPQAIVMALFDALARQLDGGTGRRIEQFRRQAEYLRALARAVEGASS